LERPINKRLLAELGNVFGTLSHAPPAPTPDQEAPALQVDPVQEIPELPLQPVISMHSGMVLFPSVRFDGDPDAPPWNMAEADLWDVLREAPIELIEERVLDGAGGVFWARVAIGEDLRSCWLKFEDPSDGMFRRWAEEYQLDDAYALLRREQAGYEIVKALGSEDLMPPLAVRDVDPVPLLSDAVRERIARHLRIAPIDVDERLGLSAILQLCPTDADDFVEHWGTLGVTPDERWLRSSDRLRHSIFRAYAIDFVLGVQERPISSYMYNMNTDRLVIPYLQLSFPHPGMTAENYLDSRAEGWGRKNFNGLDKPVEAKPASAWDLPVILEGMSEINVEEALATFDQVCSAFTDEVAVHAGRVLAGLDIPLQGIAGFYARMAYLQMEPRAVLERPIDIVRNVFVPLRRGYGVDGPTNVQIIEYVNSMIAQISDEQVDLLTILQEEPDMPQIPTQSQTDQV
jgi:hypothetical protein